MEVMNEGMRLEGMGKEGKGKGKGNEEEMMMVAYEKMRDLIGSSAVVVFSLGDCCMCHVAKHLLISLGVAPTMVELDSTDMPAAAMRHLVGDEKEALPTIFVGGKLLGGLETLIACHIDGSLVPLLKEAGALWL